MRLVSMASNTGSNAARTSTFAGGASHPWLQSARAVGRIAASAVCQPEYNTQGQPLLEGHAVTCRRSQPPVCPGFVCGGLIEPGEAARLRDLHLQHPSVNANQ